MTRHIRLTGACRADREQWLADNITPVFSVRCHQRLRGPYTGVDTVLAAVLPEAAQRWPGLVEQHRFELLYGIPELAEIIGPAPGTLASDSPFRERTRFFASDMLRCMSQGIVTFLLAHAERVAAAGERMPVLVFEDASAAEPTTQEFMALLLRRADPAVLRLVVSGEDKDLPAELAEEIAAGTDRIAAPAAQGPRPAPTAADTGRARRSLRRLARHQRRPRGDRRLPGKSPGSAETPS